MTATKHPSSDERSGTAGQPFAAAATTPGTGLPDDERHTYKVRILEDRWDGESDRIDRLYRAFGRLDARLQAEQDYPGGTVLTVELEPA